MFHIISVSWTVHMGIVPILGLLNVSRVDGYPTSLFFRSVIDVSILPSLCLTQTANVIVIAAVNVVLPWST